MAACDLCIPALAIGHRCGPLTIGPVELAWAQQWAHDGKTCTQNRDAHLQVKPHARRKVCPSNVHRNRKVYEDDEADNVDSAGDKTEGQYATDL